MYKLDRRVTIHRYTTAKNEFGGLVAVETGSWSKWAEVQDRSGDTAQQYNQSQWTDNQVFVMRYEKERPLRSNDVIEYESQFFKINNISIRREGFKSFEYVLATKLDESINSDAPMDTGNIKVYNYTATGGEFEFTSSSLVGKSVFAIFKDGIQYVEKDAGPANGKECFYDDASGSFTFGTYFEPGEIATILYY